MKNKLELLKTTKFDDCSQLIRYLTNNGFTFKVDAETKKDIYILEKGEYRNKSHHFELDTTTENGYEFIILIEKD